MSMSSDKKIADLEARLALLESLLEEERLVAKEEKPKINYTLELVAPDIEFFRDPDQIQQTVSEFLKSKKDRIAEVKARSMDFLIREQEKENGDKSLNKGPRPR